MSSTAYGESLLAGIRERNDNIRKENERQAKKNLWKSLGMQVAIGVAESVAKDKAADFLNNEELAKNRLLMKNTENEANKVLQDWEKVQAHKNGLQGFASDQLDNELLFQWNQKYAPGTYNENVYQEWRNKAKDALLEGRVNALQERFDATKSYLDGGSAADYVTRIKNQAPTGGVIDGLIGKLTGSDEADLHNLINDERVQLSKEYREKYGDAWRQTRSSNVADYVAQNFDVEPGVPAPVISKEIQTIKVSDIFGNDREISGYQVTTHTRTEDNKVIPSRSFHVLGADGKLKPFTASSQEAVLDFTQLAGALPEDRVDQGILEFNNQPAAYTAAINGIFEKQIKEATGLISGDPGFDKQLELKQESFARSVVAAGVLAGPKGEGWAATEKEGRQIYREMALQAAQEEGGVALIGQGDIFDTLNAMETLHSSQQLLNAPYMASALLGDTNKVYDGLENMSQTERNQLFADVLKEDSTVYSTLVDQGQLTKVMVFMQEIFSNPSRYNKIPDLNSKILLAAETLDMKAKDAAGSSTATKSTGSDVGKNKYLQSLTYTNLVEPEGDAETIGRNKRLTGQHKDYNDVQKAQERMEQVKQKLANVNINAIGDLSKQQLLEIKDKQVTRDFINKYQSYAKKYGEKTIVDDPRTIGVLRPDPDVDASMSTLSSILAQNLKSPIFDSFNNIPNADDATAKDYQKLYNAIAMIESNNDPNAVSPVGALGRMQVMPDTLDKPGFGITPAKDRSDAEITRVGQEYFKALFKKYGGNLYHTAAAYNWGTGNVDKWIKDGADFSELPTETQGYVTKLNKQLQG